MEKQTHWGEGRKGKTGGFFPSTHNLLKGFNSWLPQGGSQQRDNTVWIKAFAYLYDLFHIHLKV
jgi:hypothetical protein